MLTHEAKQLVQQLKKDLKGKLKNIIQRLEKSIDEGEISSQMMMHLIQDILDYSRIRNGGFRKNISNFNVRNTINHVTSMFIGKALAKGLTLNVDFHNIR